MAGWEEGRQEMKLRKHKMEKICRALWSRRLLLFILEERERIEGVTQQDCLQRIPLVQNGGPTRCGAWMGWSS